MPQLAEHREEIADIVAIAQVDLVERWPEMVNLYDREAIRDALVESLTEMSQVYGRMAAGAAADWYLRVRRENVAGRYTPLLQTPLSREQVLSNAGWATAPLARRGGPDLSLSLSRAGGVLQRLVATADRETVIGNVRRDPKATGWYRGASATCCSFCAMTAGRGAVYRSESTASFRAHNHCRCFAAPAFGRPELPDYYDRFGDEYRAAVSKVNELGEPRSAKNILREMRVLSGRP